MADRMDDLYRQIEVLLDERTKMNESWNDRCKVAELKVDRLVEFAEDIRDNYDCDTGANGVHAPHCRACVAGDLLGSPPPAADPRTRGG